MFSHPQEEGYACAPGPYTSSALRGMELGAAQGLGRGPAPTGMTRSHVPVRSQVASGTGVRAWPLFSLHFGGSQRLSRRPPARMHRKGLQPTENLFEPITSNAKLLVQLYVPGKYTHPEVAVHGGGSGVCSDDRCAVGSLAEAGSPGPSQSSHFSPTETKGESHWFQGEPQPRRTLCGPWRGGAESLCRRPSPSSASRAALRSLGGATGTYIAFNSVPGLGADGCFLPHSGSASRSSEAITHPPEDSPALGLHGETFYLGLALMGTLTSTDDYS